MGIFRQFPYSNFHEMNMDEILKIMRQMQDEWDATKTEWASYKDFIDNYFANLDVSAEVLAALHTMAYDGTLSAVMDPYLATRVAAWLNENITPTTPALDKTLSVANAAAEAEFTGFAVKSLGAKTDLIGVPDYDLIKDSGMYEATGIQYSYTGYTTSDFFPVHAGELYYYVNTTGANLTIFEFQSNTPTSSGVNERLVITHASTAGVIKLNANTNYLRFQVVTNIDSVRNKVNFFNGSYKALNFVTPSMFANSINNTDCKMIQAAAEFAINNRCDLVIDRMYTLTSGEAIRLNKYNNVDAERFCTRIYGLAGSTQMECGITKNAGSNIFMTNDAYCWSGDFIFENLNFYSTTGSGVNVFDFTRLMRVVVENCFFKNCDCVGSNTHVAGLPSGRDDYWQSVTFRSCTVIGGAGYAFYGTGCYDTVFDNVLIEHRDGGIRFQAYTDPPYTYFYFFKCRRLTIRDCCIEGLSGANIRTLDANKYPVNGCAIFIDNALSAEISNCYFEGNYKNIVIDSSVINNGDFDGYAALINNCWLGGMFNVERYGDSGTYVELMDSNMLVTINASKGSYLLENCGSERGAIIDIPLSSVNLEVIYNHNNKDSAGHGKYTYASYTYDSDTNTWTGNTPKTQDTVTVTSNNIGEADCKKYQLVSLI